MDNTFIFLFIGPTISNSMKSPHYKFPQQRTGNHLVIFLAYLVIIYGHASLTTFKKIYYVTNTTHRSTVGLCILWGLHFHHLHGSRYHLTTYTRHTLQFHMSKHKEQWGPGCVSACPPLLFLTFHCLLIWIWVFESFQLDLNPWAYPWFSPKWLTSPPSHHFFSD